MTMPATETTWMDLRRESADGYRALAALTRAGGLETLLLELVKIRASQLNGCEHCTAGHTDIALRAGEDPVRLEALVDWASSDLFTERERAALALTDAMTLLPVDGPPPEAVVARAAAWFPGDEMARLVLAITGINAWNRIALTTAMGRGGAG